MHKGCGQPSFMDGLIEERTRVQDECKQKIHALSKNIDEHRAVQAMHEPLSDEFVTMLYWKIIQNNVHYFYFEPTNRREGRVTYVEEGKMPIEMKLTNLLLLVNKFPLSNETRKRAEQYMKHAKRDDEDEATEAVYDLLKLIGTSNGFTEYDINRLPEMAPSSRHNSR
jgi:hypothetical protein